MEKKKKIKAIKKALEEAKTAKVDPKIIEKIEERLKALEEGDKPESKPRGWS